MIAEKQFKIKVIVSELEGSLPYSVMLMVEYQQLDGNVTTKEVQLGKEFSGALMHDAEIRRRIKELDNQ